MSFTPAKPTPKEMLTARDHFRSLLASPTQEREWQRFFSENPYVLSASLPLRLEAADIFPLGRAGRAEPDFAFYPRRINPIPFYGIIELKRPDSRIITISRSNVAVLTRDAQTAVRQAQIYAKRPSSFLPIELHQPSLFLGNSAYLFVIMGMSEELGRKLGNELYRESVQEILPPNLQLLPYDYILRRYEDQMPMQTYFLVPMTDELAELSPEDFATRLEEIAAAAREKGVSVTMGRVSPNSVVINFEYATRQAAERVKDLLAANGYRMTWNYVVFDGEDELWEPADFHGPRFDGTVAP
jgi:hypothetical protein